MRNSLICFLFAILFISCKNENEATDVVPVIVSQANVADSIEHKEFRDTAIGFFKWYENNRDRLYKIDYLKGGVLVNNDSTAYAIDRKEMNRYIDELEKSGYLSEGFISNYRNYLNEIADNLEKEPQYDGVVDGLNYDYMTQSQDDEGILEQMGNIKELKFKIRSKDDVTVDYEEIPNFLFLQIDFTFEDKWVIDNYRFK